MPDQPVTDHGPVLLWNQFLKVQFNFFRGRRFGETQPFGKPLDVGVDNDSLVDVEGIAKYDIGGFSANSAEFDEG